MRSLLLFVAAVATSLAVVPANAAPCAETQPLENAAHGRLRLVWADEFSGKAVDSLKWNFDREAGGWGNHELQSYTDLKENVRVRKGKLLITARSDSSGSPQFTSARLNTRGKFQFMYGRIEARIKLPIGRGLWPAFWMMSADTRSPEDGRPCAEIDIMESIGSEPKVSHFTLHVPDNKITADYVLLGRQRFSDGFHVFGFEWDADEARFLVDGKVYKRVRRTELSPWLFDREFFIVLNVAVGGDWPGSPDATTRFPQTMQVDWVRVWQR